MISGPEISCTVTVDRSGVNMPSAESKCSCVQQEESTVNPSLIDTDMDDLQETLATLSLGQASPLRMRSVSPSPPNNSSLSPGPERRRANTFTAGQLRRPRVVRERGLRSWFSPPCSPLRRLPRDPIQPSTGSFSDISDRHSSAGEGDDEDEGDEDHFSVNSTPRNFRPRARTCPENRAWRRKKLRAMNRPPTPPPCPSPTPGLMTSSLDVPGSPCKSPLGGSVEKLSRRPSHDLPSFEEED